MADQDNHNRLHTPTEPFIHCDREKDGGGGGGGGVKPWHTHFHLNYEHGKQNTRSPIRYQKWEGKEKTTNNRYPDK